MIEDVIEKKILEIEKKILEIERKNRGLLINNKSTEHSKGLQKNFTLLTKLNSMLKLIKKIPKAEY